MNGEASDCHTVRFISADFLLNVVLCVGYHLSIFARNLLLVSTFNPLICQGKFW